VVPPEQDDKLLLRRTPVFLVEKEVDGVVILTLKGKMITTDDTDQLHLHIKSTIERDIKNIILNMKNLTRISSLGIGGIMRAVTIVREAGGDLRLAGLDENIKTIFSITKLSGVIQIFDQTDQALASFA
jgi:anti-sigma B factor antagonist